MCEVNEHTPAVWAAKQNYAFTYCRCAGPSSAGAHGDTKFACARAELNVLTLTLRVKKTQVRICAT